MTVYAIYKDCGAVIPYVLEIWITAVLNGIEENFSHTNLPAVPNYIWQLM